MRINGLEEAEGDPEVHGDKVEVASDRDPEDWRANDPDAEEHDFNRGRVLGSQSERGRIVVVHLMDGLVKGTIME